jgi:uncharacterized membrane protein
MSIHSAPFLFAPFGFLLMVLVVGTIGYLGIKLARTESTDTSESDADQALETLRRRYANGEIDNEEFQERKERLVR